MSGSGDKAEYVQEQADNELVSQATEAGVDVAHVAEETVNEYGADYSNVTVVSFFEAALEQQIDAAGAETVKGIIGGSRDRSGKNWPRRFSLVRSSGDHMEISSWSGSIPDADGIDTKIPNGGLVQMRVSHDDEYDSYEAEQLDGSKQLSSEELREHLKNVAMTPESLSEAVEYEVVVVRGTIRYINPQTEFEDGEPAGDGPVLKKDERGTHQPHFEIVLKQDGNTRVRGHIEHQAYGSPLIQLTDIDKLLSDAVQRSDPGSQTDFLERPLRGREVVMIGNINSYDKSRQDGNVRHYCDIGVTGVIELPKATSEATASAGEPAPEPPEPPEPSTPEPDQTDYEKVVSTISQYCDVTNVTPNSLTPEMVEEKIDVDAPESIIAKALDALRPDSEERPPDTEESSDEPSEESESTDAAADVDDPLALLETDEGTYNCPAGGLEGGCLFSGSEAALYGHVNSDHTSDDPKEWVVEKAQEVAQ